MVMQNNDSKNENKQIEQTALQTDLQSPNNVSQEPNKKSSGRLTWILLAIAGVLVVMIVVVFVLLIVQLNDCKTNHVPNNGNVDVSSSVSDKPVESEGTIEEILGIDLDDIDHIKTGGALEQNSDYPVEDFIEEFGGREYNKANKSEGNTSHTYYVGYDEFDEVLFTLVDVGNQNLVFLKEGEFDINVDRNVLYQMEE